MMPLGLPRNFLTAPDRSIRMMPRARFGLPSWALAVLAVTVFGCWFPLFGEPVPLLDEPQSTGEKVGEFLDETSLDLLLKGSARTRPDADVPVPAAPEPALPAELESMVDLVAANEFETTTSFTESEETTGDTGEATMEILSEAGIAPDLELSEQGSTEASANAPDSSLQE
mgnify:CR=1 FL=1